MSINDVKGQTHISGSLSAIDIDHIKALVEDRLRTEFPYSDQRVYRGMITTLATSRAHLLSSKDFKQIVHLNLIATAKLIWPESNYEASTNPTLVYNAIQAFVENRYGKIKAYRE